MGYATSIKRHEAQATTEIVAAGEDFIAVKALLGHGQWLDWLDVEFAMTDRTAQRIMSVADAFGGKSDTVSHLSISVLYMIAADSTPEPARQAVIDASANGQRVTKELAKEIIAEHKPAAPRTVSPAPVEPMVFGAYQVDGDRPLPAWVTDDEADDDEEPEPESWQGEGDPALAASWVLTITAATDPAWLGQALRGCVGSEWMERLWDGYMGAA